MVQQIEIILKPKRRGFHLVTSEILSQLPKLPKIGIVNIFTKHTSCGLSINENADPDVRVDMETIFNHLVPSDDPLSACWNNSDSHHMQPEGSGRRLQCLPLTGTVAQLQTT